MEQSSVVRKAELQRKLCRCRDDVDAVAKPQRQLSEGLTNATEVDARAVPVWQSDGDDNLVPDVTKKTQ